MRKNTLHHEMMQYNSYRIADLLIQIAYPKDMNLTDTLPSFTPFVYQNIDHAAYACKVVLSYDELGMNVKDGKLLSDVSVVWGDRFRFYEHGNFYITTVQEEKYGKKWIMKSNHDFSESQIFMPLSGLSADSILNWMMMVAFGQASLGYQTILIHASSLIWHENGYAFLGKSGTGKSTHSKLWLKYIPNTELLNDDNPAIRIRKEGQVFIYGTPWSGKIPCYKSKKASLKALVRLKQADSNFFIKREGVAALATVLPSCTAIRWSKALFNEMTTTVEALVGKITIAELECLPNKEAALLCSSSVLKE